MAEHSLTVGNLYRLETISYFYRVEFIGQSETLYSFAVLDEALQPVGQMLEFTAQEMQHIKTRPAKLPQTEAVG